MKVPYLISLFGLAAVASPAPPALVAQVQAISAACNSAPLPAACQAKLVLYQTYMANLGAGVAQRALPLLYRQVLGPHYTGANLGNHRFGFGTNQPPNNATTDCDRTYYNSLEFTNRLEQGVLASQAEFGWLLHELAHVQQCAQLGSRDRYARTWFDHLQLAAMQTMNLAELHDGMAMEQAADTKRQTVWSALDNCCIDQNGRLIRPLVITALTSVNDPASPNPNHPRQIFTVQTSGGALPLTYQWLIKRQGTTLAVPVTAADGTVNGNSFTWVAYYSTGSGANAQLQTGTYQIGVTVGQARPSLPEQIRWIDAHIQLKLPTISSPSASATP